jgi:tetratricopeptide (TPR) repeat protein
MRGSYDRALKIDPKDKMSWYSRGLSLEHLERHDDAVQSFDKALKADPGYRLGYLKKGAILSKTGKSEQALAVYDKALETFPADVPLLTSKKKIEDVYYTADAITNYDYENMEAWRDKAIAARVLKRYDDSLSALERALEMKPNDLVLLSERGKTLIAKGDYQGVVSNSNVALKINPNNVDALRDKGTAYQHLRNYTEAIPRPSRALTPLWVSTPTTRRPGTARASF